MVKNLLLTLLCMFIALSAMFLTLIADMGIVGWFSFPIIMMAMVFAQRFGHAFWYAVLRVLPDYDDDCPHHLNTRTAAERDKAIKAYQTAKAYGADDDVATEYADASSDTNVVWNKPDRSVRKKPAKKKASSKKEKGESPSNFHNQ